MTKFIVGQRVLSDGEGNLGLGMVEKVSDQRVQVFYPAADQTRIYAMHNPPLSRVIFNVGDIVTDVKNQQITIKEVIEDNGIYVYSDGKNFVVETQISPLTTIDKALDKLLAGRIESPKFFDLRYRSWELKAQIDSSELLGLAGARVSAIPHQLYVAKEAADRDQTRILLADEVGLGKTIEAGLIIKRKLLRGLCQRVLLLVPENLKHQWLVEMLRKFNLEFTLFDLQRFNANRDADSANNPFEDSQLVLASIDWLTKDAKASSALINTEWDLLVVDEAHRLQVNSADYALVEQLAGAIPNVMLLTATPEQLGQESHFARLRLLDPQRFHDFEAYREEINRYQDVAKAARELLDKSELSVESTQVITNLLGDDSLLQASMEGDEQAKQKIIRALIDRHGTGRLLFRNTRASIPGFPKREMHAAFSSKPKRYDIKDLYPEVTYSAKHVDDGAKKWWEFDPRIRNLFIALRSIGFRKKILVICAHMQTAVDLSEVLKDRYRVNSVVFHEGMSIIERDRVAADFADKNGPNIMICSEIGSEGRNFQFCSNLVLFDLPEHPDLLEQRIGRLDRIGQKNDVRIYVVSIAGAMARTFAWYNKGLNVFERNCPSANELYKKFGERLNYYRGTFDLRIPENVQEWEGFLAEVAAEREKLDSAMQNGRDRLLEINSSGLGEGKKLAKKIKEQDVNLEFREYMDLVFDAFGINSEKHSESSLVLSAGEKMLDASFPLFSRADQEAITITYDRKKALFNEDMQFLTPEHPMVLGALEMILSGSMGNNTVVRLDNKAIPVGTVLVEMIFTSEVIAPSYLQLERFLTAKPLRCLLDKTNNNLADKVSFERLSNQSKNMPKEVALKFIKENRTFVLKKVTEANRQILEQHKERVNTAINNLTAELDESYARLSALSKVNPNVTPKELQLISIKKQISVEALSKANLKLDAIRILIAG